MSIEAVVLCKKNIEKKIFTEYLTLYLDYISYKNNKHHVDAEKREKAAEVFFNAFISEEKPQKRGRYLVEETIEYSLKWCF